MGVCEEGEARAESVSAPQDKPLHPYRARGAGRLSGQLMPIRSSNRSAARHPEMVAPSTVGDTR